MDDRKVKHFNWRCVYDFTRKIGHLKSLSKMGARLAHNGTEATTDRRFRELFATAFLDQTWIHHFIPESNRQSAEWRASGKSRPKTLVSS